MAEWLACDWGTTHLRAWVLDDAGTVLRRRRFEFGVSKLAAGEAARKFRMEVRPAMEANRTPALLCGMIGSTLGWTVVPYCSCPADLARIAAGIVRVGDNPPVWIVPGVQGAGIDGHSDVMRGEETQVVGWIAAEPARARGEHIICHPGTHSKWIRVEDGAITRFVTVMTGELFDLLRRHSVLKTEAPPDEKSFDEGAAAAGDGNALAARIFTTRARAVTGDGPRSPSSYLSGVLIGAEVASFSSMFGVHAQAEKPVTLIGEPHLCRWYERSMQRAGIRSLFADGEAAVIAGLTTLKKRLPFNDS